MTIGLLTNIISPHQLPLARELVNLVGVENYRYIYTEEFHSERAKMGWVDTTEGLVTRRMDAENRQWLLNADLVYSSNRDFELIEERLVVGRKTFYMSERWFKPIHGLPGWVRLIVPSYRRMCKRFVKFFNSPNFRYLPQGLWAKRDMMLICKWFTGKTYKEKMVDWGYFVAPSSAKASAYAKATADKTADKTEDSREKRLRSKVEVERDGVLKVLWVGRMLKWKRVDTIIRAVARVIKLKSKGKVEQWRGINLTLVGDGPERERLMMLAEKVNSAIRLRASTSPIITFLPSQPIEKIREIMQEHDVYVLASNGEEGWGAALNEAMEEGVKVLGTYEAGSSSFMLPESNLFHAGDYKTLAKKLMGEIPVVPIGDWSAKRAAERMIAL